MRHTQVATHDVASPATRALLERMPGPGVGPGRVGQVLGTCQQHQVVVLSSLDAHYPDRLRTLSDAPPPWPSAWRSRASAS
jgi:hypothetical protein